jgi:hypothetical protein
VLLRLTAGTQEAGFLSSFCPIAEFPALIAIKYVIYDAESLFIVQYTELIAFPAGTVRWRSICYPAFRRRSSRAGLSQYWGNRKLLLPFLLSNYKPAYPL